MSEPKTTGDLCADALILTESNRQWLAMQLVRSLPDGTRIDTMRRLQEGFRPAEELLAPGTKPKRAAKAKVAPLTKRETVAFICAFSGSVIAFHWLIGKAIGFAPAIVAGLTAALPLLLAAALMGVAALLVRSSR